MGSVPVPPTPVSRYEYVMDQEAVLFPMTVTNGSEDKISNVEFGIRWHQAGERQAAYVPALNPGESHAASAADLIDDPAAFEPHDLDEIWLARLAFFVRFTDQRGARWENVLDHSTDPRWQSRRL